MKDVVDEILQINYNNITDLFFAMTYAISSSNLKRHLQPHHWVLVLISDFGAALLVCS